MPIHPDRPAIYPVLRYKDADAAVTFLSQAFGFVPGEVTRDDEGNIVHVTLTHAHGMVMLSHTRGRAGDPFDTGPGCLYLVVDDPDAHHARAEAAGAETVMAPVDQPYGSREYAARDAEGHVWCFGTYQPEPTPAPG